MASPELEHLAGLLRRPSASLAGLEALGPDALVHLSDSVEAGYRRQRLNLEVAVSESMLLRRLLPLLRGRGQR